MVIPMERARVRWMIAAGLAFSPACTALLGGDSACPAGGMAGRRTRRRDLWQARRPSTKSAPPEVVVLGNIGICRSLCRA
ncbi:hypothetical protein BE15_03650 [Sorangium cellulosum]|uniref:Secreted protein n=2 Tax=Sorangium cellulosum TaxID=56 RepID=A0A150QAM5_SORCE|nr:hypothetical protein BE15_03650 [Sorangium cellulosum]